MQVFAVSQLSAETVDTVSWLCDFEKFYKTSSSRTLYKAGWERGRQRYHPSATSPGPNGLLQTDMCVVCMPHTHLLFLCQISVGSTVSRLTNGFSNPLVCWKFFQPSVLKPKPKMYLNTSIPVDSCLSQPPAERERERKRDEGKKG